MQAGKQVQKQVRKQGHWGKLKKLAAGGLLASGLFLLGNVDHFDSMRLFAATATINTPDSAGYDGASSGAADNVIVNGAGSLTGTYQNLQSMTSATGFTLGDDNKTKSTIQNVDVLTIGAGTKDNPYMLTTKYGSAVKDVGTVNIGPYTSINTSGSWTIDNIKLEDAKSTQAITINKGGYFTVTGTADLGSAQLVLARTQQGGTGTYGGGTLNANTLKSGKYTQEAGTATVNNYASMKQAEISGGSLTVYGAYYVSGVDDTTSGYQGLKVNHNVNMTNAASETKVNIYGAATIGKRLENTAITTFYSTLTVNGLLENKAGGTGTFGDYEGVLTTFGNARAYTVNTDAAGLIANAGTWKAYGDIASSSTLTNTGTMNVDGMIKSDFVNTSSYDASKTLISGIYYGYAKDGTANTGEISNSGTINAKGGLSSGKNFINSGTANFGSTVNVIGELNNSGKLTTEGNVNITGITDRILLVRDAQTSSGTWSYKLDTESLEGKIINTGEWTAKGGISVESTFDNSGTLNADGAIVAQSDFTNSGTANLGSTLNVVGVLTNDAAGILTTDGAVAVTGAIVNAGQWNANDKITAVSTLTNSGTLNADGVVLAQSDLTNSGTARFKSTLDVAGMLTNTDTGILTTDGIVKVVGAIDNKGTWTANGNIQGASLNNSNSLNAASDIIIDGAITNSAALNANNIQSKTLDNTGTMTVIGAIMGETLNNNDGTIGADRIIISDAIDNKAILEANTIESNSLNNSKTLTAQSVKIANQLYNTGDLTSDNISAAAINNANGTLTANGTVTVTGDFTNDAIAKIASTMNIGGSLTNNASGNLTTDGTVNAGDIANAGTWTANGAIMGNSLTNSNTLTAQDVTVKNQLDNTGNLTANNVSGQTINNETGKLVANNNINADTLNNKAELTANNVSVQTIANNGGTMTVAGTIQGTDLNNNDGEITADNILASGAIDNKAKLNANSIEGQSLNNSKTLAAQNINVKAQFDNTGDLTANNVAAQTLNNNGGTMTVAGAIQGTNLNNNDGEMTADNVLVSGAIVNKAKLNANSIEGQSLNNSKTLAAQNINVKAQLDNTGDLKANNVAAQTLNNNGGTMTVAGAIQGTNLNNNDGEMTADNVLVSGAIVNKAKLNANSVEAQSLNNSKTLTAQNVTIKDQLDNTGDLKANNVAAQTIANDGGTMTVAGTIKGTNLNNNDGEIAADNIVASGAIVNKAKLNANSIEGQSLNNSKTLAAQNITIKDQLDNTGDLTANNVAAQTLNNNGGTMTVAGAIQGTDLNNNDGEIAADSIIASGAITNADKLNANSIEGQSLNNSKTLAAQNITVKAQLDNTGDLKANNVSAQTIANNAEMTADNIIASGAITNADKLNANSIEGQSLNNSKTLTAQNITVKAQLDNTGDLTANNVSAQTLNNTKGTFAAAGAVAVSGDFTNDANAQIASTMNVGGKLANNANLTTDGTVKAGDIANAGTWNAGGAIQGKSLNNSKTLAAAENVQIDGAIDNSGTLTAGGSVEGGSLNNNGSLNMNGSLTIASDAVNNGTIATSGAGSRFSVRALKNNAGKTIDGFQEIVANGKAVNNGTITGTGAGSKYTFNNGFDNTGKNANISGVETIAVNGNMMNSGTVEVMSDVIVNNGDFTNDGGTLDLNIDKGRISKITVNNGNAAVNGGTANIEGGQKIKYGEKYVFLSADDGELTVSSALNINMEKPRLFHAKGDWNANQYWVTMARDKEYGNLPGLTPNQRNTGKYVDHLSYSLLGNEEYGNSDLYTVLEALDSSGDDNAAYNLEQLSGSAYAEQGMMGMQNTWFAHQNLANFIRPMDCKYKFDESQLRGHGAWGGFVGNSGKYRSDDNGLAHTYDSIGVITGYDFYRSDSIRGGAYFQYQNLRSTDRGITASTKSDHYDLGLYGLFQKDFGYLLASGNLSYGNYQTERHIAFGNGRTQIDRTHEGDRGSFQQSMRLEAAPTFSLGGNLLLHPFLGLTYIHMDMDDLVESGADQYVTALRTSVGDLNSLRPELGARVNACYNTDWCVLGMNTRASWVHEYCDTQAIIQNQFNNSGYNSFGDAAATYSIASTDLGRDYAWLGAGLTADTQSHWTVFANYDALMNDRSTIHTGSLGGSYNW